MFRKRRRKNTGNTPNTPQGNPRPIYVLEATPTTPTEFDNITRQHPLDVVTKTHLPPSIQLQILMAAVEQLTKDPNGFPHSGLADLARETRELIELHAFTHKDDPWT